MTDLEITKLCAEAMGLQHHVPRDAFDGEFWVMVIGYSIEDIPFVSRYDPLHDDAQAMALVKKFHLQINIWNELSTARGLLEAGWWRVDSQSQNVTARHGDLNRAICECVAKMKAGK